MKKIIFIVGSLRKGSFNRQLAQKVEELLAGRVHIAWIDYEDIPYVK